MNIFMEEFSKYFSDYRIVVGMDNASWHKSGIFKKIDNIVPLFQPAHSPEVNPAERMWRYIRENGGFKNKTFNSIKEVEDWLVTSVRSLLADKDRVKSITGFKWILDALQKNMTTG
jgi:transposase